jgi:hypothetical protein
MNNALLAKLGWEMASNSDKMWVKVMKEKYLRGKSFLKALLKLIFSWNWKGIWGSRNLLAKGICYKVSRGTTKILAPLT